MDVIAHQAVGENTNPAKIAIHLQQVEVDPSIVARVEHDLPIGSALGDVVRHAGRDQSCCSGHSETEVPADRISSRLFCMWDGSGRPLPNPSQNPSPKTSQKLSDVRRIAETVKRIVKRSKADMPV